EKANRKERDTLRDASDASEHQLVKRLAGYSPLSYTAFQTKAKQYIEQMRDYREETRQLTLERQRWQDTMDLLPWLEEDDSVGSRSRRSILSILLPFALPASLWWFDQPLAALITFVLLLGFQGFILVRKTPDPIANQRTSLADRQRQM